MRFTSFRPAICLRLVFLNFIFSIFSFGICLAQETPTALKTAEIDAFGGVYSLNPGIGTNRNLGGTVGVDFTRYFKSFPVAPSLEVRANAANGPFVNEHSILVGLKAQTDLAHRFHPYVDLLFGRGNVHYNTNAYGLTGDSSGTVNFGLGVDFDITPRWRGKVDWQTQQWHLSPSLKPSPSGVTFGVVYRIPFRRHASNGDPK